VPTLDTLIETFWTGSTVNLIRAAPIRPDHPPLLRRLGEPPAALATPLADLYQTVSGEAYRWLGLEEDQP
jgi:hypothetical protein